MGTQLGSCGGVGSHENAAYELVPGIYRERWAPRGLGSNYYSEHEFLALFKQRAPPYLDRLPANEWEWLFVMQHYGLPTRLLDWTESALVALYFAVAEHRDNGGDASVWAMNPWWLNKEALRGNYVMFTADSEAAAPWTPGRLQREAALAPIAVRPVHGSARIKAQSGVFTLHGSETGGLERLASKPGANLRKLILPAEHVDAVRQQISVAGVSDSSIFPELSGLCRELKRSFYGV